MKNTFSWSFSAAATFEQCKRKRYWSKYAMWDGWGVKATPLQRTAYRLSKMDNLYSIKGKAVEEAVMWTLQQKRRGKDETADTAYRKVAQPLMNEAWQSSKAGSWKHDPKNKCCLIEHYYGRYTDEALSDRVIEIREEVFVCLNNFIDITLPTLVDIDPLKEIAVRQGGRGDPEHFYHNGIKIYAIPDFVYWNGDRCVIIDWKSGRSRDSHHDQLALYGVWANVKHKAALDNTALLIEYLMLGRQVPVTFSEQVRDDIVTKIDSSVADMAKYLVNEDINANDPKPQEEWEMVADPDICQYCEFYELCKAELGDKVTL